MPTTHQGWASLVWGSAVLHGLAGHISTSLATDVSSVDSRKEFWLGFRNVYLFYLIF